MLFLQQRWLKQSLCHGVQLPRCCRGWPGLQNLRSQEPGRGRPQWLSPGQQSRSRQVVTNEAMAERCFVNCRAQGHFLLIWRQLPIKANRFLKDTKHGGICCLCEAVSLAQGASRHPQSPEGCGSLTHGPRTWPSGAGELRSLQTSPVPPGARGCPSRSPTPRAARLLSLLAMAGGRFSLRGSSWEPLGISLI